MNGQQATNTIGTWDDHADWYAASVATREQAGVSGDPLGILPQLLDLLGDLTGAVALDAGCGEGYLARVLAARGARVTGIDISPRLIALARARDPDGPIDFLVADLCKPLPEYGDHFDVIASYLVLNDVDDHRGFATTLSKALKPGGQMALALNNPYSSVIRKHVPDYFASNRAYPYIGMAEQGHTIHYYHRTLEEYLDAFIAAGLRLTKLVDLRTITSDQSSQRASPGRDPLDTLLPSGYRFPYFMLLGFETSP